MRRILSCFLAAALLVVILIPGVSIFAVTEDVPTLPPRERISDVSVIPYASGEPTSYWNLSASSYTAQIIDLAPDRATNTIRYFTTSSGEICISYDLYESGSDTETERIMDVKLYRRSSSASTWTYANYRTVRFKDAREATCAFTDLDPNQYYYISFESRTDGSRDSGCDISGTAVISENW